MKILWLMVARGGSKGVPRKNLREIGGDSLIAWKCAGARAAGAGEIILSTEDGEIAAEGRGQGCGWLPRPEHLASDTATTASVVTHALKSLWLHEAARYTHVMLLEPSTPYTKPAQYVQAIAMAESRDADLVVGMRESAPDVTFIGGPAADGSIADIVGQMRSVRDTRRQGFLPAWTMSGSLYLFRVEMFLRTGDIYGGEKNYGVLSDKWSGLEIDTLDDLALAEFAYEKGLVKKAEA